MICVSHSTHIFVSVLFRYATPVSTCIISQMLHLQQGKCHICYIYVTYEAHGSGWSRKLHDNVFDILSLQASKNKFNGSIQGNEGGMMGERPGRKCFIIFYTHGLLISDNFSWQKKATVGIIHE